eukprot:CAMPEP_0113879926 /NCGR_PEP_ID=MMETSP0780_2-20120614/7502_1 /TAXON_ID=652834 /ORGANISM="Palpitomonas bilix" /LENGTH=68 /DNA_ID=CAMNT_0000866547 /DNA_START=86 /DNA_END=292 /DNA_ORIENTATION=- /assembly_acc=CAM_ASM_000599
MGLVEDAVKKGLSEFGGAAGNAVDAGIDGYEAIKSLANGDLGSALESGVDAVEHGVEAVAEALVGDWL